MPCEIAGRSSWGWSKRKTFHPERISDGIHSLDSLDLCIQNDCEDCLVAHLMNVRISWISTGIFSNCVETIPVLTTAHMISCAFVLSFVQLRHRSMEDLTRTKAMQQRSHFPCPQGALRKQAVFLCARNHLTKSSRSILRRLSMLVKMDEHLGYPCIIIPIYSIYIYHGHPSTGIPTFLRIHDHPASQLYAEFDHGTSMEVSINNNISFHIIAFFQPAIITNSNDMQ